MASVEDQTALFEDILHPEMLEAIESLQQLDFEESELVNQLKKLVVKSFKTSERDYVEALIMELTLRRKEKIKTMETFKRVEDERADNTKALIKEMKKIRS